MVLYIPALQLEGGIFMDLFTLVLFSTQHGNNCGFHTQTFFSFRGAVQCLIQRPGGTRKWPIAVVAEIKPFIFVLAYFASGGVGRRDG